MMSIEYINKINKEKEDKAREFGIEPYVALQDCDEGVRSAPHIGNYIPTNWELVETYFVDNSGMGEGDEPALTYGQFISKVKQGKGYAIISAGQFQVYIAEFKRV